MTDLEYVKDICVKHGLSLYYSDGAIVLVTPDNKIAMMGGSSIPTDIDDACSSFLHQNELINVEDSINDATHPIDPAAWGGPVYAPSVDQIIQALATLAIEHAIVKYDEEIVHNVLTQRDYHVYLFYGKATLTRHDARRIGYAIEFIDRECQKARGIEDALDQERIANLREYIDG